MHCCRQRKVPFSGSSPYKNYHHGCGYFSFVRFLSVAWPYNYYTYNFSCGDILIMTDHATPLQVTEVLSKPSSCTQTHLIGCQFTLEITDGLS